MMSSEDDTDTFGLYGDKLLQKKSKRARQRVDAGEPRNSYSSIPNFSSRPTLMSGGLYGAIYSQQQQQQQQFGLFTQSGYGTTKMLNELLARQVKQAQDATGPVDSMMLQAMEAAGTQEHLSTTLSYDPVNTIASTASTQTASTTIPSNHLIDTGSATSDLAHHMLRNILQGKKELMALDQELRAVSLNSVPGGDRTSPENNNSISKNNNTNNNCVKQEINIKIETISGLNGGGGSGDINDTSEICSVNNNLSNSGSVRVIGPPATKNGTGDDNTTTRLDTGDEHSQGATNSFINRDERPCGSIPQTMQQSCQSADLLDDDMICLNSRSGSESLPSSPGSDLMKDDLDMELDKNRSNLLGSPNYQHGILVKNEPVVGVDMKRARVENIVSTMRSSPTNQPVNGCKKRKLYHPQQHDNSAAERYAAVAAGLNLGLHIQSLMLNDGDDEEEEEDERQSNTLHQNRIEKNALESQLRTMQQKLAEMQQKYVQLCSIMEHPPIHEIDDTSDDGEMVDKPKEPPPVEKPTSRSVPSSPATSPMKDVSLTPASTKSSTNSATMLSQVMGKMISNKLQGHLPTQQQHLQFNGAHPLLHHMQHLPSTDHPGPHPNGPHHAFNSAAAMYLGMNQKFFMEQESRMSKEIPEHNERSRAVSGGNSISNHISPRQQVHHPVQPVIPVTESQPRRPEPAPVPAHPPQIMTAQLSTSSGHHSNLHHIPKGSTVPADLSDRLTIMRTTNNSIGPITGTDLEGLADVLKTEISASLSNLVDSIVTRFVHQRRFLNKQSEAAAAAAEQLNKDLLMASQLLDRKSPRTKVADRTGTSQTTGTICNQISSNISSNSSQGMNAQPMLSQANISRLNGTAFPNVLGMPMHLGGAGPHDPNPNQLNMQLTQHVRPSPAAAMFQAPKPPQGMNPVAAAALYNSINVLGTHGSGPVNPFCMTEPPPRPEHNPEQNEALSLVITPKKKRHKVTDTRITPRTVSRILAQDGCVPTSQIELNQAVNFNNNNKATYTQSTSVKGETPSPRGTSSNNTAQYHQQQPPTMLPVSLPTSVAIPNPSLHESQVFSPYSPFFHGGGHGTPHAPQPAQLHHMKMSSSPPGFGGLMDPRDSPPLPHPPTMLHPALLAAAHHGSSPDYGHLRAAMDGTDRNSDCNSADIAYDGLQPTISFSNEQYFKQQQLLSLTPVNSSTLTPMHLRKAKLMFFWVRYPSSAVLKMYFPDIKFNKNNTAQLVKWFSNFREFYYIQMEKYARQAVSEGVKNADDLHVGGDSEIYRVLNLHYNRNNHIEVPQNFRFVVEQTLREFFRAIQGGKDTEQSWKKSIYKVISRMDDPVPEYFKSPNFLEQLE